MLRGMRVFNECLLYAAYLINPGERICELSIFMDERNGSERPSDLLKVTQQIIGRLWI